MSRSALSAGLHHLRSHLAREQHSTDSDEALLHAFAVHRDEDAFAVLVRRHGPMVLHVCRRVLEHEQDAEDAFQATFLVLARKAATLRKHSALASFLHGTAYRLALSAKRAAARRRKYESQAPSRSPVDPVEELSWREVRALLDEEIARLSEKYRSVFILCCLEDLSRAEAAQRLGLTERTVLSRLSTARQRLAQRLGRRGVELTAVLAASTLTTLPAPALSPLLISTTIQAALGEGTVGLVSAHVAALMESAASAAFLSKTKMVTAVVLAFSLLAGAGAWLDSVNRLRLRAETPPVASKLPLPQAKVRSPASRGNEESASRQKQSEVLTVKGRVLGPDGKPIQGRVCTPRAAQGSFLKGLPIPLSPLLQRNLPMHRDVFTSASRSQISKISLISSLMHPASVWIGSI